MLDNNLPLLGNCPKGEVGLDELFLLEFVHFQKIEGGWHDPNLNILMKYFLLRFRYFPKRGDGMTEIQLDLSQLFSHNCKLTIDTCPKQPSC